MVRDRSARLLVFASTTEILRQEKVCWSHLRPGRSAPYEIAQLVLHRDRSAQPDIRSRPDRTLVWRTPNQGFSVCVGDVIQRPVVPMDFRRQGKPIAF